MNPMRKAQPPKGPLSLLQSLSWVPILFWSMPTMGQSADLADTSTKAQALIRAEAFASDAIQAYRAGEPQLAIELYQLAHEQAPSADILFNLARIHDWALHNRKKAIVLYRRAATEPGAKPGRIAKARVRLLELQAAERQQQEDAQIVAVGPSSKLLVVSAVSRTVADTPEASSVGIGPLSWAFGAGAVAAATLGVGYGLSALAKTDRARDLCRGNTCESSQGVQAVQQAKQHGNWATGALVSSGIFLGLASWLYFRNYASGQESAALESTSQKSAGQGMQWGADVGSANVSLQLSGRW